MWCLETLERLNREAVEKEYRDRERTHRAASDADRAEGDRAEEAVTDAMEQDRAA